MERPAPFRICVDHPPEADGANIRKEPAMPSVSRRAVIHLGLDVHKDSISVAVLEPGRETPEVDKIFNDEYSVRHLIGRFSEPRSLRACYEAGPTGYDLHRLLTSLGVPCEVVAPSLIPKDPGDRVKTDRRDCRRLARLHRAGELVPIRVPTVEEEAVRDLCRARGDMVEDARCDTARRRRRSRWAAIALSGSLTDGGCRPAQTFGPGVPLGPARCEKIPAPDGRGHRRWRESMKRALLLLDVDGVINVFRPGLQEGPAWAALGGLDLAFQVQGQWLRVPRGTKDRPKRLNEPFECVWATSWEGDAATVAGARLGIDVETQLAAEVKPPRGGLAG